MLMSFLCSFPDVPVPPIVAPVLSLSTANKKQLLAYKTKLAMDKFKAHKLDTGSTPVQRESTATHSSSFQSLSNECCLYSRRVDRENQQSVSTCVGA